MAVPALVGPLLVPVARKLAQKGLSRLAAVLLDGPAAEAVAGPIVDRVFSELDLPESARATPDKAVEGLIADRGPEVGAIVDRVARENADVWADLWKAQVADLHRTIRAEHEARSLLTRLWRPVFGFGFTAVYLLIGIALAIAILSAADPLNALVGVSGLLTAFIGAGAAVLGVQVWSRGAEKRTGAA
ncbi:MAG: hypothetical protein AAGF59_12400 [Pseudomonadota bacterium]